MAVLLTTENFVAGYGARLRDVCAAVGLALEPITLPRSDKDRLAPALLEQITVACSPDDFDADPGFARRFLGSALRAVNLRWMHLPNAGVDIPCSAVCSRRACG